jgi:hypothetical protein
MPINHHVALTKGLYMIIYIVELILLGFPKPVYIDKTSDTCGTAVKFSKDEGIFVSLAMNSCRTRGMGMYGFQSLNHENKVKVKGHDTGGYFT